MLSKSSRILHTYISSKLQWTLPLCAYRPFLFYRKWPASEFRIGNIVKMIDICSSRPACSTRLFFSPTKYLKKKKPFTLLNVYNQAHTTNNRWSKINNVSGGVRRRETDTKVYPRVVRDWLVAAVGGILRCYYCHGADTIWLSLSVTYDNNIWCICFFKGAINYNYYKYTDLW